MTPSAIPERNGHTVRSEARRARQRAAARAYGEFLGGRPQDEAEVQLVESSNDIALRGAEW